LHFVNLYSLGEIQVKYVAGNLSITGAIEELCAFVHSRRPGQLRTAIAADDQAASAGRHQAWIMEREKESNCRTTRQLSTPKHLRPV
jgi:hypothetical protein